MERILTYAEFSKNFDEQGEVLGNTEQDVQTLASATDQFTAATSDECGCDTPLDAATSSEVASEPVMSIEAGEISSEDSPVKTEVEIITDDVADDNAVEDVEDDSILSDETDEDKLI